jgi:hypothetical protein
MRRRSRGFDPSLNLDWINDEWLWLHSTEPLLEEIPSWSEEEILHICECLLQDSLRNLFDNRCSLETVVEIHKWITYDNDPNPFSFANCCRLTGLDPDAIRDSVLYRLAKIRKFLH